MTIRIPNQRNVEVRATLITDRSVCPHCGVAGVSEWVSAAVVGGEKDQRGRYETEATTCPNPACGNVTVLFSEHLFGIFGGTVKRYARPAQRPVRGAPEQVRVESPDIAEDFAQAAAILDLSPKASAAMSRRCLQNVIRRKAGITRHTLFAEVEALLARNDLPTLLAEHVDYLRQLGNAAAHPLQNEVTGEIVDVDVDAARWSLDLLEELFDHFYVKPARGIAARRALEEKQGGSGSAATGAP